MIKLIFLNFQVKNILKWLKYNNKNIIHINIYFYVYLIFCFRFTVTTSNRRNTTK
jgi:hypothetical protein